jgi:hypothetical protein
MNEKDLDQRLKEAEFRRILPQSTNNKSMAFRHIFPG